MLQPPTRVYAANARRTSPSVARRSQFAGGVQLSRGAATAVTESAPASARTGALLVARSNSPRLVHVAGCGVATGVAVRSSDDALRSAAAVLICLLTKASIIAVQDCTKTKKHHNSGESRMVPEVRLGCAAGQDSKFGFRSCSPRALEPNQLSRHGPLPFS